MNDEYKIAKNKADKCDQEIIKAFKEGKSFKVEAGAGSGKTYSLMKLLNWINDNKGKTYINKGQKIACITYTNAAVGVIRQRLGTNNLVSVSTIHSFAWNILSIYQYEMLKILKKTNFFKTDFNKEKIEYNKVKYDLGVRYIEDNTLYLTHDDIIKLFSIMLDNNKFRKVIASKYPVIFIDEYQDSNEKIVKKFINYFIENDEKTSHIQFGFFGDSWQTIYKSNNAIGEIESKKIVTIKKNINFRSRPEIVNTLNNIRPTLTQKSALGKGGTITIIHCNDFKEERNSKKFFEGDLPVNEIRKRLNVIQKHMGNTYNGTSKTLMLTHNILANQQDYSDLYSKIGTDFKDKNDKLMNYVTDVIKPVIDALKEKSGKKLFDAIGNRRPPITSVKYKLEWNQLKLKLDKNDDKTIFDILRIIDESKMIPMPDNIKEIYNKMISSKDEKYNEKCTYNELSKIKYSEFDKAATFLKPDSKYSTDHGVKGEEYDNVIFVIGKGWNLYDFSEVLPDIPKKCEDVEDDKLRNRYERHRNLFYVGCSRAKENLVLLITCNLKDKFRKYLSNIFGEENIISYTDYINTKCKLTTKS